MLQLLADHYILAFFIACMILWLPFIKWGPDEDGIHS